MEYCSLFLSLLKDTASATIGAKRRRMLTLLYLNVATRVGTKDDMTPALVLITTMSLWGS